MTEPHHEPSYYEIALTNRQVVVAFVILLVCLLSAFFSGVWIGRGSADRGGEQTAQLARPSLAVEPTEGRSLEELKFFSDEAAAKRRGRQGKSDAETDAVGSPRSQAPPAPAPVQSAPPVQSPPPAAPVPRSSPAPPVVDEDRASSDHGAHDAVVRSRPLPENGGAREAPEAADTEAGAGQPAARPGAGAVVIQVFASADPNEAKKMRDRLTRGGEPAFVSPLTVDGRTMYRVRVGPFSSRPRAQKEADRVRKAYKLDTWLTE
ncbi:MAG TPA: SPOR domain-containing protein [Thermoanaerobaculia bacterium]